MKKPKNKGEVMKLIKEKPYLIIIIGLGLILLSPLIKILGIVLLFGGCGYYLMKYVKEKEKKDDKKKNH